MHREEAAQEPGHTSCAVAAGLHHTALMQLMLQVRFGGRTGAAPVILGISKLALGLLFGSSLLQLLQRFPQSLLGAMLVFSGATCPVLYLCWPHTPLCRKMQT